MPQRCEDTFASIESAQEFLALLAEAISETRRDVDAEIQRDEAGDPRRTDALKIASYDLEVLEHHIYRSKRLLNDLRKVRRLLLEQRGVPQEELPTLPAPIPLVRMELPVPRPQLLRKTRGKKQVRREDSVQTAAAAR